MEKMTDKDLHQINPQEKINQETPKTIAQLDTLIDNPLVQKEQKATYFILSAFLPPLTIYLALFFSYRKKLLYKTLPYLLIVYGAITLVFNLLGLISVGTPQQATQLGVTFDEKLNSEVKLLTIATTILAAICLLVGFYFKKRAKKNLALDTKSLWILFLFLNILIYGVIFLMFKESSLLFSSISPVVNSGYQGL